ncbi:transient receptor potential channel [Chlorella sorokiniana]|uniref:Transient receptor potential channel n=1 Tax=Chlorella sorokiniana TaxID=3076 RepID=A0A2P6TGR8_CHLSO|nr:transient receptor potential channel [Chlorella sorokiniana]|eukprot:PRW33312.1 transient receptor potential channel [Chlorella sorokiniana]
MADNLGSSEPLLEDLEGQGDVEGEVTEQCTVRRVFAEWPAGVLRFIQDKGVTKLGEFEEDDGLVFTAFEDTQLLTFGSDRRRLDFEAEWRRRLREMCGKRKCEGGWNNQVAVEAFVVSIRDAAAPDKRGLLQPLLKRYQARRCSYAVFALPAVQAVIKFKWLVSFNVFTIAFQDEDLSLSLRDLLKDGRGRVTVAFELLALVGMAPFLMLELGTIPAYGIAAWFDIWNGLDVLTYFLQARCEGRWLSGIAITVTLAVAKTCQLLPFLYYIQIGITVMHLGRFWTKSEWLTTMLAVQCILLVFRLQYFTQCFQKVRFAYLPIIKEVWGDLRPLLLIMWGFATAFCVALRRDQDAQVMKPFWSSKSPKIATALAVAYTFIQGTVIINLLLGIVINSLEKVTEHHSMKLLLNQARVIDELESTMPRWLERRHPDWFPAYVHMLRINPDRLDRDELWTRMGRDEPQVLQKAESHPLKEGHPRHVNGDSEEGEDEAGSGEGNGTGGGGGKGKEGRAEAEGPAGPSGAASGSASGARGGLEQRMAAMQAQLEEQGRLLREMAARLAPPGGGASMGGGGPGWAAS